MKQELSEQLKKVKTDNSELSDYGKLPLREDVIIFDAGFYEKLYMLLMVSMYYVYYNS